MTGPAPLPERDPIPFTIDGQHFELGHISTRQWLDALAYEPVTCWWLPFMGALPDTAQAGLIHRLQDNADPLDIDDLEKYALTVLEARLGMDFFAAHRLVAFARSNWLIFDGWMIEKSGVDPLTLPVDRIAHAAYNMQLQGAEKDSDHYKINSKIFAPPDGTRASGRDWADDPAVTRSIDELESNAFMQALSMSR